MTEDEASEMALQRLEHAEQALASDGVQIDVLRDFLADDYSAVRMEALEYLMVNGLPASLVPDVQNIEAQDKSVACEMRSTALLYIHGLESDPSFEDRITDTLYRLAWLIFTKQIRDQHGEDLPYLALMAADLRPHIAETVTNLLLSAGAANKEGVESLRRMAVLFKNKTATALQK